MLVGERFWFWLLETDLYYLLHACPMCYNTPVMYVTLITAIGFKLHIISRDTGMLSSAWRNRLHEEFMVEGNKVRSMLLVSGNRLEGWNIFLQKDIHCLIWCFDRSGAERCEACVSIIWVPVTVVPCMHVGSLNCLMSVTSYTTDPGGISHWSSSRSDGGGCSSVKKQQPKPANLQRNLMLASCVSAIQILLSCC